MVWLFRQFGVTLHLSDQTVFSGPLAEAGSSPGPRRMVWDVDSLAQRPQAHCGSVPLPVGSSASPTPCPATCHHLLKESQAPHWIPGSSMAKVTALVTYPVSGGNKPASMEPRGWRDRRSLGGWASGGKWDGPRWQAGV